MRARPAARLVARSEASVARGGPLSPGGMHKWQRQGNSGSRLRARHLRLRWQRGESGKGLLGEGGDKDSCRFPICHLPAAPSGTPAPSRKRPGLWEWRESPQPALTSVPMALPPAGPVNEPVHSPAPTSTHNLFTSSSLRPTVF